MTRTLWIASASGVACLVALGVIVIWRSRRRKKPPVQNTDFVDVRHQTSALDRAITYLNYYRSEFSSRRRTVKKRARNAVVVTASFNAGIAVVGAIVTLTGWSELGLVSTLLAGGVAVVAAWDGHFRHRDLWVQRSLILQQLEQALRDTEIKRRISNLASDDLALEAMSELDRILKEDIDSWASIRKIDEVGRAHVSTSGGSELDSTTTTPEESR